MKKYFIKTFGCQMNVSDSERIASFLESKNFTVAEKINDADLVIFNTCGIKQTAENRAYSLINNLRKKHKTWSMEHGVKQKNAGLKIIMTGCLAHRTDVQKRMKGKVDFFCEIKNFEKDFENNLENTSRDALQCVSTRDYLSIAPKYQNNFQAYVPIMTGCNNFCSYCVVPYARGREASRPAEEIISEVKDLVTRGYKSITLLGQNVNSYASHNSRINTNEKLIRTNVNFPILLKKLDKIPGKFWISFVSSHPKDMSDELIKTVAKCKKVCEWIHLPVQAGNDKVLEKMNRKYTQAHYLKLIGKIKSNFRKYKPNVPYSISSDMIVGFPSETKSQFMDSAKVMEKSKFDMVFFGQFSPRPGTVAWKMKDNVSQKEKARRENFLNEILKKTTFANNKKYVGETLEVLIEKVETKSPIGDLVSTQTYFGKTRTQKNVKIISVKKNLVGTFVKAKITEANVWNLEGILD